MTIWDYISNRDPLLLGVVLIMIIYGLYKGIVKIPWIDWPKKDSPEAIRPCKDHYQQLHNAKVIAVAPYYLVRDQMSMSEDIQDKIRSLLYKHFIKLLKDYRNGNKLGLIKDPETEDFEVYLDYAIARSKQKVKFFYQENHLAEMTEAEFQAKSKERIEQIISIFTAEMNEIYGSRMDISRERLYDHNQELLPEIKTILADMFVKARILAIENRDKIKALEDI